ncbi:MAG TPA: MoaD/ThiS family protein [Gemmatimonadaceae bacterium]|nr:MoaD/ThiS family protein [Gemmatimonadaceae bacterium]
MPAVTVHLFAAYAESFGVRNLKIEIPPHSRVADLVAELRALPGSHILPESPRVAVNQKFAADDQVLDLTDEIAIIPPVAGG